MQKIKELVRWWRQARRPAVSCRRPVRDLIQFGRTPGVVLDVGANKGGFATDILVSVPLMQVHCFEPNSVLAERLQRLAAGWGVHAGVPRCVVTHAGVGSEVGRKQLNVTAMDGASSFLKVSNACNVGWPSVDFTNTKIEDVAIIRLDDYLNAAGIENVKLLKIDVQGFELEVLKGCGDRIKDISYIIAEVQFTPLYDNAPLWNEIVSYASSFGFAPIVMDGFCFGPEGQPLQADILLKRP